MPKRSSKKPKHEDEAQAAVRVMGVIAAHSEADAESEPEITDAMREAARSFGRIGGKIGGKKRAEKLTAEKRAEIARRAANARWTPKRTP